MNGSSLTVLAVDCSTDTCSVAISLKSGELVYRENAEPRSHAKALLPMVDAILAETGLGLTQLDSLAVAAGPGSFTGLRIAMSAVQGLAFGTGLPVQCVTSLHAMAYQSLSCREPYTTLPSSLTRMVPILDARMSEVYWAVYDQTETEKARVLVAPRVSDYDSFCEALGGLETQSKRLCIPLGSAWSIPGIRDVLEGDRFEDVMPILPNASGVLAVLRDQQVDFQQPCDLEPLYLRNEITWKKRIRVRAQDH